MNIFKKTFLLITVLTGGLMFAGVASPVHAQIFEGSKDQACRGANLNENDPACKSDQAATSVQTTIKNIVNLLSIVVGIVAVILIIINGLRFITANGDANSISSARNGVIYAVVGLIVAALAQVIVRFVLGRI